MVEHPAVQAPVESTKKGLQSDKMNVGGKEALLAKDEETKPTKPKKENDIENWEEPKPPKGVLWIDSKGHHDCAFDPKSESPLASCRSGKAPKDNY